MSPCRKGRIAKVLSRSVDLLYVLESIRVKMQEIMVMIHNETLFHLGYLGPASIFIQPISRQNQL